MATSRDELDGFAGLFPAWLLGRTLDDNGRWLYDWVEVAMDPRDGRYREASPARSGRVVGGEPDGARANPAREASNRAVDVRVREMGGYQSRPVVWMRTRGVSGAERVYEFVASGAGFVRGRLDQTLTRGGQATLSLWAVGGDGVDADTGEDVTVYDDILGEGQTVPAETPAHAQWDERSGRYFLTQARCL